MYICIYAYMCVYIYIYVYTYIGLLGPCLTVKPGQSMDIFLKNDLHGNKEIHLNNVVPTLKGYFKKMRNLSVSLSLYLCIYECIHICVYTYIYIHT